MSIGLFRYTHAHYICITEVSISQISHFFCFYPSCSTFINYEYTLFNWKICFAGLASASAYERWEKAAIAGVSLVADAAEQLERVDTDKEAEYQETPGCKFFP